MVTHQVVSNRRELKPNKHRGEIRSHEGYVIYLNPRCLVASAQAVGRKPLPTPTNIWGLLRTVIHLVDEFGQLFDLSGTIRKSFRFLRNLIEGHIAGVGAFTK